MNLFTIFLCQGDEEFIEKEEDQKKYLEHHNDITKVNYVLYGESPSSKSCNRIFNV